MNGDFSCGHIRQKSLRMGGLRRGLRSRWLMKKNFRVEERSIIRCGYAGKSIGSGESATSISGGFFGW
jgi:hypothetical protein